MSQYGFFIDLSRCIGCHACVIACKQWHDIPPGPTKWMRVYQWEKGVFPNVKINVLPITCFHCEKPICIKACPNRALYKEGKYGAVLVETNKCRGARKCWLVCPYGAPQYDGDEPDLKMSKCNMCIDRLKEGLKPICILSCSMRALEFGPLDELKKKYDTETKLDYMPKDSITKPAVVFKPSDPKKQVVSWDSHRALALWKKRQTHLGESLPDIFLEESDVIDIPGNIVGRNQLVLKAKNWTELMYYTTDDE